MQRKGDWLTSRSDIRVLDCTIRDGGLVNGFDFQDEFVRAVYETCVHAGVDYMEVGYKASKKIFSPATNGACKFCDEEYLREIIGEKENGIKISVMADVDRTDYKEDIPQKDQSIVDMYRVATYIHQIPSAIEMIKDISAKGYETSINIMAVSIVNEKELYKALDLLGQTDVNVIYLVDSFGSLYSEDIERFMTGYSEIAQKYGKSVGIHAHNNQQLAYANTLEAMMLGASFLDATIAGLGRGAGNCPMELLLGFLKNPKYSLRPVIKCIEEQIVPFKKENEWGFDLPYMLTGQMNMHPKPAIEFMDKGKDDRDYLAFYDTITDAN